VDVFLLPGSRPRRLAAISHQPATLLVKVKVSLRLAVYLQSVCLEAKPLETYDQIFFTTEHLRSIVLIEHPLWREDGFVSYECAWPIVKCSYRTYSMILKIFPFALYTSPLSTGFAEQIMPILRISCYNGNLIAKFKRLIFFWSCSQIHIATDGQSISKSWGSWPDIYYSLTITVLFLCGALSNERTVCLLHMLLVLASVVFLLSESLWDSWP
jgi:hypothetical protein